MIISDNQHPEYFKYASKQLNGNYSPEKGHKVITCVRTNGPILAQAIFTSISPGVKAELTVWATQHGLAGREFFRAISRVVFEQWKCQRLTAITRASNANAHRGLMVMGFEFEAPLARWFGDEDGWCYRMFPEKCRWLTKATNEQ